ncbi:MAG: hypothetical protein JOY99_12915 [Sphingomonadaceae bacterium]|nr:hypothetical protein [Sphingomonadaceae bacterium]
MVGVAVGAGTALIGGVVQSSAASDAADAQVQAANAAAGVQQNMYNQTRADLLPYQQYGQTGGINQLQAMSGYLNTPFSMTQSQLEQTPGYQFDLSQGLKSVNNQLGARGLLNSGAVMKGAANYATGLADNTYQNQFNMDQTQKTNIYNRLAGIATLGEDAAAKTGAAGIQTSGVQSQALTNAGNAAATGAINSGNAYNNAFQGVSNSLLARTNPFSAGVYGGGFSLPSSFGGGSPIDSSYYYNPDYTYG